MSALIFDGAGNLYGTTYAGGHYYYGTAFQLSPNANGGWTEKVIHDFRSNGIDGFDIYAGLTIDAAGNLYGAAEDGGAHYVGTVFELSVAEGGDWLERTLHNFYNDGKDGSDPSSDLTFDASGNLYGVSGGGDYGWGAVYEITP